MVLSPHERQLRYRKKIRHGELWRIQVIVDLETDIRFKALCKALGITQKDFITKLITEEWERQGELTEN